MTDKADFSFPSKYDMKEIVQLNFGRHGIIRPALIIGINFTPGKICYDLSFKYSDSVWVDLFNVDSCFIEDFGQVKPNEFASISDVKAELNKAKDKEIDDVIKKLNASFYKNASDETT